MSLAFVDHPKPGPSDLLLPESRPPREPWQPDGRYRDNYNSSWYILVNPQKPKLAPRKRNPIGRREPECDGVRCGTRCLRYRKPPRRAWCAICGMAPSWFHAPGPKPKRIWGVDTIHDAWGRVVNPGGKDRSNIPAFKFPFGRHDTLEICNQCRRRANDGGGWSQPIPAGWTMNHWRRMHKNAEGCTSYDPAKDDTERSRDNPLTWTLSDKPIDGVFATMRPIY
jgi:hypothetical protein